MTTQTPSQLGICSWSTHPKNPQDLIDRVRELGLDKVQLALGPLINEPKIWGDAPKLLRAAGIKIVSGMFGTAMDDYSTLETIRLTGGFVPDAGWEKNRLTVLATAKLAQELGIKIVSSHAGFIPPDKRSSDFGRLVERIAEVATIFYRHNVTFIFETGQETADSLNQFLDALQAKGHRNLGINFDPANMILYNMGDPVMSLKKLMPRVKQIHIKDACRTSVPGTWGREMAIGEGEVNWEGLFQTLVANEYKGDLIIEREAGADRVGDVRKAIELMKQVMLNVR